MVTDPAGAVLGPLSRDVSPQIWLGGVVGAETAGVVEAYELKGARPQVPPAKPIVKAMAMPHFRRVMI
jgi:hypothetical protein